MSVIIVWFKKNAVYQATIFPKENVKDKKIILEFRQLVGS